MYGGTYGDLNTKLLLAAESDRTQENVSRGEYRFLLMEYTRMGLELAEYKGKYRSQKRILYAALKDWDKYNAMGTAHRALFDALKEEFETETEEEAEGSLAE